MQRAEQISGLPRSTSSHFRRRAKNTSSPGPSTFPAWSPDGRELFFIAPQFKTTPGRVGFASVNVSTSFGFTFGNPAPFDRRFNVTGAAIGRRRTYDVLPPDGRRFIGVIDAETERDSSSTAELHVVTNWFESS